MRTLAAAPRPLVDPGSTAHAPGVSSVRPGAEARPIVPIDPGPALEPSGHEPAPASLPQHPLLAMLGALRLGPAVGAALLGATLVLTGCSTVPQPLPGGVAPKVEVAKAWTQGSEGNCVTVASIKAAQVVFDTLDGPTGVFRAVVRDDAGYSITMRDGFECRLSHAEVKQAERGSGFRVWSEKKSRDAVFLFACSAKRAQLEGNDGLAPPQLTFAKAMATLNDGESVVQLEAFQRLGLSGCTRYVSPADALRYEAVVVCNDKHAWFVSGGYGDAYGRIQPLGREGWGGHTAVALVRPDELAR